jgi:uncharacterized membrane protein
MKCILFRKHESKILFFLKNHFIAVLILGAIIAMAISLAVGLSQSVWFDEAYSIMLAKQPVSQIIHLTSVDTHPPLYYLLLSGWGNIFGWSELALRSLSVLAMGGAVIISGLLTKKMFGLRALIITLPFVAFAPFLLRYSFEIRMYAVASLIGIAATYVLVLALDAKEKQRLWLYVLYAVLVAVGVYTLYYTVLLWVAHLIWLLWRSYSKKEALLSSIWLKSYVLSVILFLPWLPTFFHQITNGALAPISQSMTLDNLLGIISFSFLYRPVWQLDALLSLVALFVILMIGYLCVQSFKVVDRKQKPYLILLAMYVLVPIAILTLVGLVRPMYVERYLAHVLIGGSMLIGVAVALVTARSKKVLKVLSATLVVVMAIGIIQLIQVGNYNFQRLQHPDVKQAAAVITECQPGTVVLAADPYVEIELSYYLPLCKINFYSETASLGGGYAALTYSKSRIADPSAQLISAKTIYYVYYGDAKLKMPANMITKTKQSFGNLTVKKLSAARA